MAAQAVFTLSNLQTVDGMVVGPAWSDDQSRELLRVVRRACPATPDVHPEDPASLDDFMDAVRVLHEVLSPGMYSGSDRWPLFVGPSARPSVFKCAVRHTHDLADLLALCRLSDSEALLAWNVARWMLCLPQQVSATMVFAAPPPAHSPPPRLRPRAIRPEACVAV